METTIVYWGYIGIILGLLPNITPIMENQMEKKMKIKWKLGLCRGYKSYLERLL